jgi:hypothetical protein
MFCFSVFLDGSVREKGSLGAATFTFYYGTSLDANGSSWD